MPDLHYEHPAVPELQFRDTPIGAFLPDLFDMT